MKFKTLVAVVCAVLTLAMVGCSNLTPNQNLHLDQAAYVAADVGLTAGLKTGKIPASALPMIQKDMAIAAQDITAGAQWVAANPNLANTMGVYPTEFTLMHSAVQVLADLVLNYGLVAPLPTNIVIPPAATQPTTQP